jgi:PhnB protein
VSFVAANSPTLRRVAQSHEKEIRRAHHSTDSVHHFNGNAADAIRHYEQILGAKVERSVRYGEMAGGVPQPENESRIMHCELKLGACTLMVSDAPAEHEGIIGSNVEVGLAYDNEGDMRKAFEGLAAEREVAVPLHDAAWGGKFGMLVDGYGIHWMFTYGQPAD